MIDIAGLRQRILVRVPCRCLLQPLRLLHPAAVLSWFVLPFAVYVMTAHASPPHIVYARSNPSPGDVLTSAPRRVVIWVDPGLDERAHFGIAVIGPDGVRSDDGVTVPDDHARARFSTGLAGVFRGRYTVHFQARSATGDDLGRGAFSFYANARPTAEQRALDAHLAEALSQAEDQPGAATSDPLLAMGVALAASLACWIATGLVYLGLRRRASRCGRPPADVQDERHALLDYMLWRE